jgi:MoaA/NifB/PqqE/SkfB family radical SAM enzyme
MIVGLTGILKKIFNKDNPAPSATSIADPMVAGYNLNRESSLHHSICMAPSVNMLFAIDGTVKACCHNHENSLGRYPDQTIKEIWTSLDTQHFRQLLAQYKFLSGCSTCAFDYSSGNFDQMMAQTFDHLPQRPDYPSMMEFLYSNTCNLECVMCTGELSSSIRKNRDKLPPLRSPYDDAFIDQLEEFIPHLSEVRFSGAGEAFAIDINYPLWEKLITQNPKCIITVQTNGTILNARVRDFLERGNFNIGVSLDSLDKETFESIRINASYDQVIKNIEYFADYSLKRGKHMTISMCVMRQNWKELPAFVRFCNRTGALITFHKVWTPLKYAIYNLPAPVLESIYTELSSHTFPSGSALEIKNKNHYVYFVSVIKKWMEDAQSRSEGVDSMEHLSVEELDQYAKTRLQKYITGHTMLETDKEELIRICQQKIDDVLGLWNDEAKKRTLLTKLCLIKESELLPALKTQTIEKLYEMSVATADT